MIFNTKSRLFGATCDTKGKIYVTLLKILVGVIYTISNSYQNRHFLGQNFKVIPLSCYYWRNSGKSQINLLSLIWLQQSSRRLFCWKTFTRILYFFLNIEKSSFSRRFQISLRKLHNFMISKSRWKYWYLSQCLWITCFTYS